jgi:exopolysaccharide production protein ExoQ
MSTVTSAWRRMQSAGLTSDVLLAALVLVVLSGSVSSVLSERYVPEGPNFELWPYQYPFAGAGLVGAALLGSSRPRFATPAARIALGALVAYVGWSLWSVTWSVIPSVTSGRAMTSVGIACFAVWFGTGLTVERQLLAVATALALFIAGSAFVVAFVPSYGRGTWDDSSIDRFRGLTTNPNSLGPLCVLSVVTFVAMAWRALDGRVRAAWAVGAVVAFVLLVGSRSNTAFVAAAVAGVGAVAMFGARELKRRRTSGRDVAVGTAVAVAIGSVFVWKWFWSISELLTGDETFGNRRRIWDQMIRTAELRPWRGWGYWAFWNVTDSGAVIRLGSAHNSAIEVYLGLGRIGVAIFALIVALAVLGAASRLWESFSLPAIWLSIVLLVLLVGHLTESFVLWHSYNWALVCAMSVGCWAGARSAGQTS